MGPQPIYGFGGHYEYSENLLNVLFNTLKMEDFIQLIKIAYWLLSEMILPHSTTK